MEQPSPVAISEMELFANGDGSKMLVTLLCESRGAAEGFARWAERLRAALPAAVSGVRVQLEDGSLSPPILAAAGEASLMYEAAGFAYRVDHGAFFQVNRWLVDEFVALVTEGHTGKVAWDLFAGVGLFARRLAQRFGEVIAVESAPASTEALRQNLSGTGGRAVAATTLEFLRRNREERAARPDFLVVDPPRAGLGDETTRLLNAIGAPEMVYVSCDPATLARDLKALTGERYRIERITLVDMFPQTFHLETVVHLVRS
jgi:23S rRNA (uracil1939-C5)-methyltransferase